MDSSNDLPEAKAQILEAASALFANKGFSGVSMSQVAGRADVSKALVFWHFRSKEELFKSILLKVIAEFSGRYDSDIPKVLEGLSEKEQIIKLIDLYCDFIEQNREFAKMVLNWFLSRDGVGDDLRQELRLLYLRFQEIMSELFREGRKKKLFSQGLKPDAAASFVTAILDGIFLKVLLFDDLGNDLEAVKEFLKGFIRDST